MTRALRERGGGPITAAARIPESGRIRALRLALAALFLLAGLGKLAGLEATRETFEAFGYSQDFRLLIGALETAGAIGLLVPGLVFWAALGLCGIMLGALYSHVMHDPLYMAIPAVVVLILLTTVAVGRSRAFSATLEQDARPTG